MAEDLTTETPQQEEDQDDNRIEIIVKILVLLWSASMLTLSYYEPPSGKKIVDFDPTFIASIFSGSLASFGISASKNGKKKQPKIPKNNVGIGNAP